MILNFSWGGPVGLRPPVGLGLWHGVGRGCGMGLAWGCHGGRRPTGNGGCGGGKNDEKIKVLGMGFSIVEILSGLQESIFSLSRRPQLHFN